MQERATLHGGDVRFESAPGLGTTVFVDLPLARVPVEIEANASEQASVG